MSLYFKGIKLEEGAKHYFNGSHIKNIYIRTPNDSDYIQVYHYDSSMPTLTLTSPSAGEVISSNRSTFTISGSVADTESGIASVTINGVAQTINNGAFTYTTGNDTQDYVINVTDNAGNVRTKTVHIVRENYNNVRKWKSGDSPGNETYWEYCSCQVCGAGGSAHKWRGNGQNVYNDPDTLFSTCPNYPHHKYTISIT